MKFPPDLSTAHGTPEERRAFGRATSIATRRVLNQFVVRRIRELREQREGNKIRSAEGMLPPSRKPFAVKDPHPSQQFPDPDVQYREIGTGYELLTEKQKEAVALLAGPARHICLVGGARSGKTVAIVRAIIIRALRAPGSRHAILRFRSNAVWPSVGMQTLPFVFSRFFPDLKPEFRSGDRYVRLPNGSEIWLGGLDADERAEKILGKEYSTIFFNECSEIPYSSVLLALSRLAETSGNLRQRAFYDLNPTGNGHWTNLVFGEKKDPISKRPFDNPENYARMFLNPRDNAQNLSAEFLQSLDELPERMRRRFRDGIYQDETENSLWSEAVIEETRVAPSQVPQLDRVLVAVDPSGAKNSFDNTHDPIGIVVVGRGIDGHGYVLADDTLLGGPSDWGKAAIAAFHAWKADSIVAEVNFGGAMVEHVLRSLDPSIPYREVSASRGKVQRAEPVAVLYNQRKVHHVGRFLELEEEMYQFTDLGFNGLRSPNRVDALVWGLTELLVTESAAGWADFYRERMQSSAKRILTPSPSFSPGKRIRLLAPTPFAQFYASSSRGHSRQVSANEQGIIEIEEEFLDALTKAGCKPIGDSYGI